MMKVLKGALVPVAFCLTGGTASSAPILPLLCSDFASANDLMTAASQQDLNCMTTPDEVEFKVYDISLCTNRPEVGSVGSCTSIFNSASGKEVLVSSSTSVSLDPGVSLENGDYSYVSLTLDERIGVKVAFDVGFAINGWGSTQGNYCWSNGSDVDTYGQNAAFSGNVRCGSLQDSLSQAAMSYESINVFDGTVPNTVSSSLNDEPSRDGGTFDIRLINSTGQLASDQDINTDVYVDTDKLFVIIELPTVQRVDENSTNIDVGFKVTDLVNMKLSDPSQPSINCSLQMVCFKDATINSISFYATIR